MKKLTLTCTILWAACAFTFAGAPERYQSKEPIVELPQCAQFGGWEFGANVGGAVLDSTWNDNDNWIDNFSSDFNTSNPSKSREGVTLGGSVGYNFQRGCALFGLEADGSWTSIEGTDHHSPFPDGTELRIHDALNFWGSVRARSGVVVDNLLLYVTGGFAFADIDHDWSVGDRSPDAVNSQSSAVNAPDGQFSGMESFSADSFRWGGVAGVGAEWAINKKWSLRSEFLYIHFIEDNTSGFSEAGNQEVHFDTQDAMFVSRFALVYRFGSGN